jgi:putative endonuclease
VGALKSLAKQGFFIPDIGLCLPAGSLWISNLYPILAPIISGFFMNFFVYILYSKKADRFYIGQTEDPDKRFDLHQSKFFQQSYTRISNDWIMVFSLSCMNRTQAILIEQFIKKQKSKVFIQRLIDSTDGGQWLIDKFS